MRSIGAAISGSLTAAVPWNAYSFSGAWHTGSKLVLCAVMLRGRHRGLPVAIDKAILLPHRTLAWAEEEDALILRCYEPDGALRPVSVQLGIPGEIDEVDLLERNARPANLVFRSREVKTLRIKPRLT